jgi:hypothetical protein
MRATRGRRPTSQRHRLDRFNRLLNDASLIGCVIDALPHGVRLILSAVADVLCRYAQTDALAVGAVASPLAQEIAV